MFNLPVFVGIDYHHKVIQVCVINQQKQILANQSVENDPEAIFRVVAPFGNNVHAAIEASTGVAEFAEQLINKYSWSVELAHPGYVARMKQTPDKSDWTDAKLLADLTRAGYIPRVWLAPQYIRNLRELIRYRHGLVQQRTQAKLRLRAALRNHRVVCPYSPWTIRQWKAMSARLQANGKKKCAVIAAVANRWIRRLFYQMVRSESSGNPA
jgi:transposase